tara:strand:+ start:1910 stop:5617 length:3708 start_codon:yes stop_codon:yes gene_type:complete
MSSLKSLYQNNRQGTTVGKYLKSSAPGTLGSGVESGAHLNALTARNDYFLPPINYADPENFVKFGSAYEYYKNAFEYIASDYPYDGSGLEKTNFYNNINPLEKYTLEVIYPRSTGFVTIGADYGTAYSNSSGYYSSSLDQYVQVKGGPHLATKFNEAKNRTSNLEFGGPSGSTVEFFLKKDSLIDSGSESPRQVVFDLTNGVTNSGSADYGRLRIELVSGSETQFNITMLSGATGFNNVSVPSTAGQTTISDGAWRNFSFVFDTSGSSGIPSIDFYVNGACVETGIAGASNIATVVTGTLIGNLGALRQSPSGSTGLTEGAGKLSASIDEFRFWKTKRNAEQVGRYWFSNVEGGSDKYDANVSLGVYFKFNEGVAEVTATDQIVLDYSGRISNGTFTGYTANCRNTGSAIDQLSIESVSERGDPIIRTIHPSYISTKNSYELSGSTYDQGNNARLLNHLPNWIVEEEENSNNEIIALTQILSGYFDTLYNQLTAIKKLKYINYVSGSLTDSIDEFPHNDRLIENFGLETPELFENADVLAQFFQRDEQIDFDQQLVDIKNTIYKNIYNNLNFILKSKGNEKAIRNFIRCLGVGEEVLAFNTYSDDTDFEITSSYNTTVSTKRYVDYTALLNQGDAEATAYQYYDSSNTNSVGLISGSNQLEEYALTLQSEFIFPDKSEQDKLSYVVPSVVSSSLFGFHTPNDTSPTSTDLTWESAANDYGLQVYAVKSPAEFAEIVAPASRVKDAYFIVKDRAGNILLTSNIFRNVYENERWSLSLTLKPKKYPLSDGVLGSSVSTSGYELGFYGVNFDTGVKQNYFNLTTDLTYASGSSIIGSAKRVYLGAHKTNFTGSTLTSTDVRASSTRYWTDYFPPEVLDIQAREVDTHGSLHPSRNSYLFQTASAGVYTPSIQTLALNWEFAEITGSDTNGRFIIQDASSGLNDGSYEATYQGDIFSNINLRQHTGRGDFFTANATPVRKQYVYADKLLPPEYIASSEMVKVLSTDDEVFGTFKKPASSFFAIEKSMYRSISNRMLHLFASIKDFNNLIGEPVNKYRMNYKHMEKMREIFFRKVQNDTVDLQKYLDYYKWLDSAMTQMLDQLMPASARYAANVRNIVESHTLERNKIQYRAPLLTEPGSPSRRRVITGDVGGNDVPMGEGGDPDDSDLPEIRPAEDNPRDQGGIIIALIDPDAEQEQEQENQLPPGAEDEGKKTPDDSEPEQADDEDNWLDQFPPLNFG